ncbi:MAG: phosphatidylglycerophosphatase A [Pseudomonadota bacterium]
MALFRPLPDGISFWHPATLLATVGGVGLVRVASGTWGSAVAVLLAYAIAHWLGSWGLLAASIAIFLIGIWASNYVARSGEKDSSAIVIDEVAGQWLALTTAGLNPWLLVVGFLGFRLVDISKPWPISWLDREVPGGLGVMLDDMAAGAAVALVLWLVTMMWS